MNQYAKSFVLLSLIGFVSLGLTSCGRVAVKDQNISQVPVDGNPSPTASQSESGAVKLVEPINMAEEREVADQCLIAWRKALKGDEKGSMSVLNDLAKKYPKANTVYFMQGQVMEQLGKKKEAVDFYTKALSKSRFNSMYMFKLAESLRASGDAEGSITQYRKLINTHPDFAPARLGLAQALIIIEPKSEEAKQQIKQVMEKEPDNKEAKDLLAKLSKQN
jgi:tetratricopeptide (TPR) repeat protein